jgi:uncharacterized protein YqeY
MKSHDQARVDVLTSAINTIKNMAIAAKCKENISKELVMEGLRKEQKTWQEMVDSCPLDRVEILTNYKERLEIIKTFVPQLITDELEITNFVKTVAEKNEIELTKANKGKLMKIIMPMAKGGYDAAVVNKVIGNLLQ